jgi:hypothetical protein
MKGGWEFLIGTAVTGFPALAFAQPNIPPAVSTAVNQTDDLQEKRTSAPCGRSDSLLSGLGGEIEINGGEPKASLSFNGKLSPEIVATGSDGMNSSFRQTSYGLSLSVPLGGNDNLVDPQLLDRLSDGPALTFSLSRYNATTRDDPSGLKNQFWQFGGEARIGTNQFHYRDPTTLTKYSSWKPQLAIGGFIAFYPGEQKSMLSFAIDYQSSYQAADEKILCKPLVTDPDKDCFKAAPQAPDRQDAVNLSFEYRQAIGKDVLDASLAFSPKFTYDALSDDYGVELPVYLIPKGDAQILPGFRIGYASREDEVTFGLFMKASFSMTK